MTLDAFHCDTERLDGLASEDRVRQGCEARALFEPAEPEAPRKNPLHALAAEKLRSAEVLLQQQCRADVMSLLASTLLLKLAALHGQTQSPTATEAAAWLYGEILPRGILSPEQVSTAIQVVSRSLGRSLPDALIRQAAADTVRLFSRWAELG